MWHVTRLGGWTFSQKFSSLAPTVCDLWYYEDLEEKDDWLNEWINYEAVYRTAPATPGLLTITNQPWCRPSRPTTRTGSRRRCRASSRRSTIKGQRKKEGRGRGRREERRGEERGWQDISRFINRPGVAGAVLQSPPLLTDSFIDWSFSPLIFETLSIKTESARKLNFWENVHPTLSVMCYVSPVTCHMSPVTCHLSYITCHLSTVICPIFFFFLFSNIYIYIFSSSSILQNKLDIVVELVNEGSVINGAYPV